MGEEARSNAAGAVHALGDGLHDLPVGIATGSGIERLSSRDCILLLFVYWAQRRGWDAVAIHRRACPGVRPLRPDQLLFCRPWVEIPEDIDTAALASDLEEIGLGAVVETIREIEAGRWAPPEAFSHWVVTDDGRVAGEARGLDPPDRPDAHGQHFCHVRLFAMPEMAEWGYMSAAQLRAKSFG
jgi:hypothetical protein